MSGTSDIIKNLANLSSTTFKPNIFSISPSRGLTTTRMQSRPRADSNISITSQSSFKAAFGVNMRGSGVFEDAVMEVTPKDPKCTNHAPSVKASAGRLKKAESFSKPLY